MLVDDVGKQLKPSGSCMDAVSACLFKDVLSTIAPDVLIIENSSLSTGEVPKDFKHAIIQQILKKTGMDPSTLSSFRPISRLLSLSKNFGTFFFHLTDIFFR